MAYAAWSVIAGEQPTAAKWNILGTNDASFNDGTGIGTNAILAGKLGLSNTFTGGVASQANAGSAGGTMYYINLGGIKLLWGTSAIINTTTTATQYNFTLPASFFNTIQTAIASCEPLTADAKQLNNIASATTSNIGVYMWASTTATAQTFIYIIGT